LPYQGNKLFLYVVCTIAVTIDRTLRNTFTGRPTFYFVETVLETRLLL